MDWWINNARISPEMGEIDSGLTPIDFRFLTRAKEVVNQVRPLAPGIPVNITFTSVHLFGGNTAIEWVAQSPHYLLYGTWRLALGPAGRRLPIRFVRLVMRKLLSLTWFCFVVSIVLGASVFMVGFVGAQTPEFDPNEGVDPDAPPLDPFVVYEWAGSGSSCGVSGELIGAVGSAASDHGLVEGFSYSADGTLQPALYGATGDGSQENLATLIDTDLGAIDGDERWDRPVGPFQLLPISWTLYGGDANLDGVSDPQNLWDASAAAAEFLCAMGAGPSGNDFTAVRRYTGSERLSQRVLSRYEQILACLLYTSPSPRDRQKSRMPSSA